MRRRAAADIVLRPRCETLRRPVLFVADRSSSAEIAWSSRPRSSLSSCTIASKFVMAAEL